MFITFNTNNYWNRLSNSITIRLKNYSKKTAICNKEDCKNNTLSVLFERSYFYDKSSYRQSSN